MACINCAISFSTKNTPASVKKMIRDMNIFREGVSSGLERLDVRFGLNDISKAEVCARWETLQAAKQMLKEFPQAVEEASKGEVRVVAEPMLMVDPAHLKE